MPRKKITDQSTASSMNNVTEETEKKVGLFDVLDMIQGKRTPWEELPDGYKEAYSIFMINRFMSSVEFLCPLIDKISTLKTLTNEQHYYILTHSIPTGRKLWFNYKAFKKEKLEKDTEFYLWALMKEYQIGKKDAKLYLSLLSNGEKEQLKKKWEDIFKEYK